MDKPLVSVICLCYNQQDYVVETLNSVVSQTYDNIQLIIVDDASTDQSKKLINKWLEGHPHVPFLALERNIGNTAAFNKALELAEGKYIIDLACDDVLLVDRIARQVELFERQTDMVGVLYGDVQYITEDGVPIGNHFEHGRYQPYESDVFSKLIDTYFVPPPSMMMKTMVLNELSGYDEQLAYEDFDFWVRSSRQWHYVYQPEVLTKVRKVKKSLSHQSYKPEDRQLHSTYLVCLKIQRLIKNQDEKESLIRRVKYEMRQSAFSANHKEFELFYQLLGQLTHPPLIYKWMRMINRLELNLSFIRNAYHFLRYG